MKKTPVSVLSSIAVAGVLAIGLSACGSDSDSNAATMPTTTMSTTHEMTHDMVSAGTPAADLRVTLDRLFGEHAMLAVVTMQKGFNGDEDFQASADALEANTVDLGKAVGSVYGPEAEAGFLKLWRQHIGFFVDYTVATAKKDEAGREKALTNLEGYRQAFATFLANANPNLKADDVAGLLQMHVGQLTEALDTYASGDYEEAAAALREAYAHMFMTGDALAGAIVAQMPENFQTP